MSEKPKGQFRRIAACERQPIVCIVDGEHLQALEGDTVLTAILLHRRFCGSFEFAPGSRAGFCLMGACQDCWVRRANGEPVRACTTLVEPGMEILTNSQGIAHAGARTCPRSGEAMGGDETSG